MEETRKFNNILLAKPINTDSIWKPLSHKNSEKIQTLPEDDILIDILLLRLYIVHVHSYR